MRGIWFIWFLFFATVASAQTAVVRSGEHAGFTRLVLSLPSRMEWSLNTSDQLAELKIEADSLSFDTDAVFQRISRTRIKALNTNPQTGVLAISLACDCTISAFWHDEALLVLDITGQEADIIDSPETAPVPVSKTEAERNLAAAVAAALAETRRHHEETREMELPVRGITEPIPSEADSVNRDRLLRQFSRAINQGLLTSKKPMIPAQQESDPGTPQTQIVKPAEKKQKNTAHMPTGSPNVNIRSQTSIDRDFLEKQAPDNLTVTQSGCLPEMALDLSSWGREAPFGQQVGPLRTSLLGEFDKVDADIAISLAKLYLYFGFGAEARHVLTMAPQTAETGLLMEMSEILDTGYVTQPVHLARQVGCDSAAALWSALAHKIIPKETPVNSEAVLLSFMGLPGHLQSYLGPVLSRRFLTSGHESMAEDIMRILKRRPSAPSPEEQMVDAQIALEQGDDQDAEHALEQVISGNSPSAANALSDMIELHLRSGEHISYETAQLAGAYAQEGRDHENADRLDKAYILALAASGAFDEAFLRLEAMKADARGRHPDLHSELFSILANQAEDITFLRYMSHSQMAKLADLKADITNIAARRLLELGFPHRAVEFVETETTSTAERARRKLRAEIFLTLRRPRQAEVELLELDGVDINLLRAQARNQYGEHEGAHHLFMSAGQKAEAKHAAWLAEDWATLTHSDEKALSDFAMLRRESDTSSQDAVYSGVLEQNRVLLDQSETMRDVVSGLLQSRAAPGADAN